MRNTSDTPVLKWDFLVSGVLQNQGIEDWKCLFMHRKLMSMQERKQQQKNKTLNSNTAPVLKVSSADLAWIL